MFELEKANYTLEPIKFGCDNPLAAHIMPPFPSQSFFMLIVGKPGSGKTTLLLQMLTSEKENRIYREVFDKILLVMPSNSRRSMKDDPFDDLPPDQLFDEFNDDVIEKVKDVKDEFDALEKKEEEERNKNKLLKKKGLIKKVPNKKKRYYNQLLILDDVTATLKNKNVLKSMIELATNRRHLRLSIILLVQFSRAVPRPVRFQITDVVLFKPSNNLDTAIIAEEFVNKKKDEFMNLIRFVYTDSHDFLMVNKNTEAMFKNLQRIIMPESSDAATSAVVAA